MAEIEDMFKFLSSLEVDGHTISPGYDYDAAKKDMVKRLGRDPKEFFLTRDMTRQKFAKIQDWGKAFTIFGTPVYQEFLAGKRELTCTAWAIPTYNVKGWKAPCYLMTDGHYGGYQEMLTKVKWEKYGVVNGVARDPRCEHCMVHCGYDPSGALGTNYQSRRQLEKFQIQLRRETEAVSGLAGTGEARLQRRDHRQRPSGRGESRHQFARRRRARRVLGNEDPATKNMSAALAAAKATPARKMICWRKSRTTKKLSKFCSRNSNEQDPLSFTAEF